MSKCNLKRVSMSSLGEILLGKKKCNSSSGEKFWKVSAFMFIVFVIFIHHIYSAYYVYSVYYVYYAYSVYYVYSDKAWNFSELGLGFRV